MGVNARQLLLFTAVLPAVLLSACNAQSPATNGATMRIHLASTAFSEGQPIPSRHAYDHQDISPDLQWSGVPSSAKSLMLICDDPDAPAGTWVHWTLYDLTPSLSGIHEDQPKTPTLDIGAKQGMNDFKRLGYDGPAPPPGKPHHYYFKLYALDIRPDLKPGLTKKDLLQVMNGHVMAQGELMGTYQRQ